MRKRSSLARAVAGVLTLAATAASAAAPTVLYRFTGHGDGANPTSALVLDRRGDLFGVASQGGAGNGAVIYELSPGRAGWSERAIHDFPARASGGVPYGALTIGRDGALLGTVTHYPTGGSGEVFSLRPPADPATGAFAYSTLIRFPGSHSPRGAFPSGRLLLGAKGEIFGVTSAGGEEKGAHPCDCGLVYRTAKDGAGGWSETVLSVFRPLPDGQSPVAGLTRGPAGFLVGATSLGGTGRCKDGSGVTVVGCGVLYAIAGDGEGAKRVTLHSFGLSQPSQPADELTLGPDGALYGFSVYVAYRFAPPLTPGGRWTPSVIHSFPAGIAGQAPVGAPVFDRQGNIYGITRSFGLDGPVSIFRLAPPKGDPAGRWSLTDLYRTGRSNFGDQPAGGLVRAADGTLYGAIGPGANGSLGYVFSFKP